MGWFRVVMIWLGVAWIVAVSITFLELFFMAYFSHNYMAWIHINYFGEANLEAVVFPLFMFPTAYSVFLLLRIFFGDIKSAAEKDKECEMRR
jgi:hypothetical protein